MSLSDIQNHISSAVSKANRKIDMVRLIAVSKMQPNERVASVLDQGHRYFGENRVQ
ncbi:MAG: YggS family pyridoxal phosphate-dependent enzyme, partial [Tateyamaria sp.]|nr:YggS family pyridoxal phosphate-dependent enzyme [Tateyamaria sp.]